MNVSKYEEEKMLIISDSLDEYFGDQQHMLFKKNLANYANQMGKSGFQF